MLAPHNPFFLAPMAGITDMPFRRLMKRLGAGGVISEFVSAHGIVRKIPRLKQYLNYHNDERPVGIQIFGDEAGVLAEAARIVQDTGVDFLDINLGCPVPKVTKKGGGSAWLTRPTELGHMLHTVKSGLKIPLTIKIRTGWDACSINAPEILKVAQEEGVTWVAVHGRTRTQGYAGRADWDLLAELAQTQKMPIIGNGDIVSGPMAAARLAQSKNMGVMIGRGALKNPWIFKEAVEAWEKLRVLPQHKQDALVENVLQSQLPPAGDVPAGKGYYERKVRAKQPRPVAFCADWVRIRADRNPQALINEHIALLRDCYPEERVLFCFRKFLAWYAAGYPGAHEFRKFIFNHQIFDEIVDSALNFFESVKRVGDSDREAAPVLMSGHG